VHIGLSVAHHAVRRPSSSAVEDGDRRLTYAQLDERANRVGNLLSGLGLVAGERVAYFLLNRLEVAELLVGAAKAGVIAAPLNFRLGESDLRAILENAAPRVVFTEPEFADLVRAVAAGIGAEVVLVDGNYEELLAAASPAAPEAMVRVRGDSDALIQYTSGTTGRSKGATFTHDAVLSHAANVALEYDVTPDSRVLVSIPHNSATNIQTVPSLYRGSTVVFTDPRSFEGAGWIETVNRVGATHCQVVPTMLYRVLESWHLHPVSMPSMRRLGYGSAPIPPERVEELLGVFGNVFLQLYGMIEVAAIGTMLRPEEHVWALEEAPEVLASVGQSSYGMHVRVVDDDGADVADGERGEVAFQAPYMMRGYWDSPDLTAETIRNGWLHSGDIGEYRHGWLYLVDRKKDLIIRGGQNIASKEVEEALYTHPAVMEVAVVGVPEPEWGEDIAAAVMVRPGTQVTPEELVGACAAAGLARFKMPSRIEFVDDLPRNAIGKIQKGELRRRFAAGRRTR
jgi:fatty-acyl-CoA synthase